MYILHNQSQNTFLWAKRIYTKTCKFFKEIIKTAVVNFIYPSFYYLVNKYY
jgi:hypothetical protein